MEITISLSSWMVEGVPSLFKSGSKQGRLGSVSRESWVFSVRDNVWMVSVLGQSQGSESQMRKHLPGVTQLTECRPPLTSPSSVSSSLHELPLEWSLHICDLTHSFSKGPKSSSCVTLSLEDPRSLCSYQVPLPHLQDLCHGEVWRILGHTTPAVAG